MGAIAVLGFSWAVHAEKKKPVAAEKVEEEVTA
jgi:hypothetical protein